MCGQGFRLFGVIDSIKDESEANAKVALHLSST